MQTKQPAQPSAGSGEISRRRMRTKCPLLHDTMQLYVISGRQHILQSRQFRQRCVRLAKVVQGARRLEQQLRAWRCGRVPRQRWLLCFKEIKSRLDQAVSFLPVCPSTLLPLIPRRPVLLPLLLRVPAPLHPAPQSLIGVG